MKSWEEEFLAHHQDVFFSLTSFRSGSEVSEGTPAITLKSVIQLLVEICQQEFRFPYKKVFGGFLLQ